MTSTARYLSCAIIDSKNIFLFNFWKDISLSNVVATCRDILSLCSLKNRIPLGPHNGFSSTLEHSFLCITFSFPYISKCHIYRVKENKFLSSIKMPKLCSCMLVKWRMKRRKKHVFFLVRKNKIQMNSFGISIASLTFSGLSIWTIKFFGTFEENFLYLSVYLVPIQCISKVKLVILDYFVQFRVFQLSFSAFRFPCALRFYSFQFFQFLIFVSFWIRWISYFNEVQNDFGNKIDRNLAVTRNKTVHCVQMMSYSSRFHTLNAPHNRIWITFEMLLTIDFERTFYGFTRIIKYWISIQVVKQTPNEWKGRCEQLRSSRNVRAAEQQQQWQSLSLSELSRINRKCWKGQFLWYSSADRTSLAKGRFLLAANFFPKRKTFWFFQ